MTKKLELISRNDIDGKWFIVRLSVEGQSNKDLFKRNEQEAIDAFTEAHKNLSILGDEVVLKSETYPPTKVDVEKSPEKPKVRKVYISTDTGECYESIPEGHTGNFYDIMTDAPTHFVAKAYFLHGSSDTPIHSTIAELKEIGFFAFR